MRSDGRQILPLARWGRVLRWLTSHPLVGLILTLLAIVGAQGARLRYRDRRAARLQDAADRERVRLARDRARRRRWPTHAPAGARGQAPVRAADEDARHPMPATGRPGYSTAHPSGRRA